MIYYHTPQLNYEPNEDRDGKLAWWLFSLCSHHLTHASTSASSAPSIAIFSPVAVAAALCLGYLGARMFFLSLLILLLLLLKVLSTILYSTVLPPFCFVLFWFRFCSFKLYILQSLIPFIRHIPSEVTKALSQEKIAHATPMSGMDLCLSFIHGFETFCAHLDPPQKSRRFPALFSSPRNDCFSASQTI